MAAINFRCYCSCRCSLAFWGTYTETQIAKILKQWDREHKSHEKISERDFDWRERMERADDHASDYRI